MRNIIYISVICGVLFTLMSCQPRYEKQENILWKKVELTSIDWEIVSRAPMTFYSIWRRKSAEDVYRDTLHDISFITTLQERIVHLKPKADSLEPDARIACLLYKNDFSSDTLIISRFTVQFNETYYDFDEELLKVIASKLPNNQQLQIQRFLEIRKEIEEEDK